MTIICDGSSDHYACNGGHVPWNSEVGIVAPTCIPPNTDKVVICSQQNQDLLLKTICHRSVAVHVVLCWHHLKRSQWCWCVKDKNHKGRQDCRFPCARHLEMVLADMGFLCAPATCLWMMDKETVGTLCFSLTIKRSSLLVVCLGCPDLVCHLWVPLCVHCSQHNRTVKSEQPKW